MTQQDSLALVGIPSAEARLIRYFLVRPETRPHLREIQRALGLGGASVQRGLNRLVELGALKRTEEDCGVLYSAVPRASVWSALRRLEYEAQDPMPLLRDALIDVQGIAAAFVFGSMATGRIDEESDIDLLVVAQASLDRRELCGGKEVAGGWCERSVREPAVNVCAMVIMERRGGLRSMMVPPHPRHPALRHGR
jgi:predicted nucleotidyltransferase